MKDFQSNSTYRTLLLLNFLYKKEMSKLEILETFKKQGIETSKTALNNYFEKLSQCGFTIEKTTKNSIVKYSIKKNSQGYLSLSKSDIRVLKDVKNLIILEKDYNYIRILMRIFYKFAKFIKDDETKATLIDFGYYSTINWELVRQLEKHCNNSDIIEFDYIMPDGTNRFIEMHVDSLKIKGTSKRLYLNGLLNNARRFSNIPVDRIFMIKRVVRNSKRFHLYFQPLIFVVSSQSAKNIKLDKSETILKQNETYTAIRSIADDDFYILQRLLNFAPDIYYISDNRLKELYKEKLEIMKDAYGDKFDF